jgi:hypothetical protein
MPSRNARTGHRTGLGFSPEETRERAKGLVVGLMLLGGISSSSVPASFMTPVGGVAMRGTRVAMVTSSFARVICDWRIVNSHLVNGGRRQGRGHRNKGR